MAIISYIRGNLVEYDGHRWLYSEDKTPITYDKPCTQCGKYPTPEGHDACLGYIDGAVWACCGHGVRKPYIIWRNRWA